MRDRNGGSAVSTQLALLDAISERDRVLAAIAQKRENGIYLQFVRPIARELAQRNGYVSIDDVRAELQRRDFPLPEEAGLDSRVFGALFRCKAFIAVTQRPTTRIAVAARWGRARSNVTVYKLADVA